MITVSVPDPPNEVFGLASIDSKLSSLRHLVGNTPLLVIRFSYKGRIRRLFAKAEYLNLTGSIKDRMALHLVEKAYSDGSLVSGDTIVEATSGNTGISLAAIGSALGHPVVIYMPDYMSSERRKLIEGYGALVIPVSAKQGGFLGCIRLAEEYALHHHHVFLPRQFENPNNRSAHASTTGPEIIRQMASEGLMPDAFVAGVGTGGTVMGVADSFRRVIPNARVFPVEPEESPTLSTGHKIGSHRIQGISDEFIPAILQLDQLDEVLAVRDGDSILMAQKLSTTLGLGVGISSGCNFLAAVMAQDRLGLGANIATVFCDDNKKYLSTDLFSVEQIHESYMTPSIELIDFRVLSRTPVLSDG